jgi:hypothetical protein
MLCKNTYIGFCLIGGKRSVKELGQADAYMRPERNEREEYVGRWL